MSLRLKIALVDDNQAQVDGMERIVRAVFRPTVPTHFDERRRSPPLLYVPRKFEAYDRETMRAFKPDILVLDLLMPDGVGGERAGPVFPMAERHADDAQLVVMKTTGSFYRDDLVFQYLSGHPRVKTVEGITWHRQLEDALRVWVRAGGVFQWLRSRVSNVARFERVDWPLDALVNLEADEGPALEGKIRRVLRGNKDCTEGGEGKRLRQGCYWVVPAGVLGETPLEALDCLGGASVPIVRLVDVDSPSTVRSERVVYLHQRDLSPDLIEREIESLGKVLEPWKVKLELMEMERALSEPESVSSADVIHMTFHNVTGNGWVRYERERLCELVSMVGPRVVVLQSCDSVSLMSEVSSVLEAGAHAVVVSSAQIPRSEADHWTWSFHHAYQITRDVGIATAYARAALGRSGSGAWRVGYQAYVARNSSVCVATVG
ncbi:MAG: hypothetical protein H6721_01145 [Sandaracinus sp.]|nr:hypothetical protein [Sandaracinus sp.]MCB9615982.1 hypothetical protein [Sandaracinus sp.]MCB9621857.1 hypothetical protein [Sandaracinus sp.]MCB9630750.1 hypothetical protein [Sandaracinus sp.]